MTLRDYPIKDIQYGSDSVRAGMYPLSSNTAKVSQNEFIFFQCGLCARLCCFFFHLRKQKRYILTLWTICVSDNKKQKKNHRNVWKQDIFCLYHISVNCEGNTIERKPNTYAFISRSVLNI